VKKRETKPKAAAVSGSITWSTERAMSLISSLLRRKLPRRRMKAKYRRTKKEISISK
jgi:hypothetical protein